MSVNKILTLTLAVMIFVYQIDVAAQGYPPGACAQLQNSTTCIDSTPCKVVAGGGTVCLAGATAPVGAYTSASKCWDYQTTYSCLVKQDDCGSLQTNPLCVENSGSPVCAHSDPKLGCDMNTHTYTCQVIPPSSTQVQVCTNTSSSVGLSWSSSSAPSAADLGKAAAMMEARREVGVYSPDGLNIFAGKPMTGTKGYLGLKNCLKTSGGAQSNGSIAKNLGMQAAGAGVMAGAKYGAQVGANIVYDSFFTSGSQAMSGFAQWAGMNAPEAGMGFAGFGTSAAGAGGLLGSSGSIAIGAEFAADGAMIAGSEVLWFNPYAFAAMVAIQVVMEMTKCTEDEQKLSQMRGANLCQQVGSYCSQELNLGFAKICVETTESFCCFNGLLPLVVNQQGRPQVGKGWGSARSPDCSGFSTAQLTALDWSKIDLSTVVAQMQANFNAPSASQFGAAAVGNMQSRGQAK